MKTIVNTKALLLDSTGNMLILYRSDTHPTRAGRADLPGGQVDFGEDIGQALVREITEETGLSVLLSDLQPIYGGAEVYENDNRVRMLYIGHLPTEKPAIQLSREHSRSAWIPISELEQLETEYHSFYQDALHYIREHNLVKV